MRFTFLVLWEGRPSLCVPLIYQPQHILKIVFIPYVDICFGNALGRVTNLTLAPNLLEVSSPLESGLCFLEALASVAPSFIPALKGLRLT